MSGIKIPPLFCPKCRKRVLPPRFLKNLQIQSKVTIKCPYKDCSGGEIIVGRNQAEPEEKSLELQQAALAAERTPLELPKDIDEPAGKDEIIEPPKETLTENTVKTTEPTKRK